MMARLRRAGGWRDWSAVAAVLALVIQMGVAVAHDPWSGAIAAWSDAPLCHAVTNSDDGSAPAQPLPCPICFGLAASSAALLPLPPPADVLLSPPLLLPPVQPAALLQRPHAPLATAQPRAPPVRA